MTVTLLKNQGLLPDVPDRDAVVEGGIGPTPTFTVKLVDTAVDVPICPEIFDDVLAATGLVVIGNVADVAPAATVTVAGTTTDAKLLVSVTAIPPVGAAPLIVTVPVDPEPPVTVVGDSTMELATGARTVIPACRVPPSAVPVMVTDALLATG